MLDLIFPPIAGLEGEDQIFAVGEMDYGCCMIVWFSNIINTLHLQGIPQMFLFEI